MFLNFSFSLILCISELFNFINFYTWTYFLINSPSIEKKLIEIFIFTEVTIINMDRVTNIVIRIKSNSDQANEQKRIRTNNLLL